MVSFTEHEGRVPLETIEREFPELLPTLVDHSGVGFMLVRSTEFGPVVLAVSYTLLKAWLGMDSPPRR